MFMTVMSYEHIMNNTSTSNEFSFLGQYILLLYIYNIYIYIIIKMPNPKINIIFLYLLQLACDKIDIMN